MCCWVLMFKSLNFLGPSNFPILSINPFCRTQGTIPWQLQAHPGRSSREASVSLWRHWSTSASTASSMMAFLWMTLFPYSLASQIPRSAPSVILVPWLVSTCTTQWTLLRLMRWRMLLFCVLGFLSHLHQCYPELVAFILQLLPASHQWT